MEQSGGRCGTACVKESKRRQPQWPKPSDDQLCTLTLFNSFTRQKEKFIPQKGNRVTWYSCGPTVYDAAHMGHARSYITFDILRRVLRDYFGYELFYVMNITDIDDKIIKRARQDYLFKNYMTEYRTQGNVLSDLKKTKEFITEKSNSIANSDKRQMLEKLLKNLSLMIEELVHTHEDDKNDLIEKHTEIIQECRDALSDWLDQEYGNTVNDNAIFSSLPRYWEREFHMDMQALNILKPDALTRVSEYIPEIIKYIETIISNGFGYVTNGSVYFDVVTFDKDSRFSYAKLVPEAYGDLTTLQEGEGDLTSLEQRREKQSPNDFALWKKSKAGEPAWESPWGLGRPGWHIECSAMASSLIGSHLDIHTGGVDLKFPHHDNEIAQSEAYFGKSPWVNYFLHSGHLTIAGCKMSKSLKNFITIKEALTKYTACQLRFAFLLHSWKDTLDYSSNTMEMALSYERLFQEFFLNVKDNLRSIKNSFKRWSQADIDLNVKYLNAKDEVHKALCNNVDTRGAVDVLKNLVLTYNVYLKNHVDDTNGDLVQSIAMYVTHILKIFGVISERSSFGFPIEENGSFQKEETVMPYLEVLSKFRNDVRTIARSEKSTEILRVCDQLRDNDLLELGVRLEDKEGGGSAVKLVDRDILMKERDQKRLTELEKERERERRKAELQAKEDEKRISPSEMFLNQQEKYSKFDENGLPTHDANGLELSKGLLKKLKKLQLAQQKRHEEYLNTLPK